MIAGCEAANGVRRSKAGVDYSEPLLTIEPADGASDSDDGGGGGSGGACAAAVGNVLLSIGCGLGAGALGWVLGHGALT